MHGLVPSLSTPLPAAAVRLLEEAGFLDPPRVPETVIPRPQGLRQLVGVPAEIHRALTQQPLNERQAEILRIYWNARREGEEALPIEEVARRLSESGLVSRDKAVDFVKGALRSFGRRLFATLSRSPIKTGRDRDGEGVGNEVPLMAMIEIIPVPRGAARHRMTADGAFAVAVALGLDRDGSDPEAAAAGDGTVLLAMSPRSAALILQAQRTLGGSIDDAIEAMAAALASRAG